MVDLEAGKVYRFRHRRKGEFTATVLAVEETKPGDPDPYMIRVSIPTGPGSPNAWMANSYVYVDGRKTTPSETEKLLRPSLILGVEAI